MKKEKINIITFHNAFNYGAILQTYSLNRYLNNKADVQIINFDTSLHKEPIGLKFNGSLKSFIAKAISYTHYFEYLKMRKKFLIFRNNLSLTPKIDSFDKLKKLSADIFITGSDQVFNVSLDKNLRKAYYLNFVNDKNSKKYSYGASFGITKPEGEKKYEVQEYLKTFNYITLREKSGCRIINDLGFNNYDLVLDPVFLTSKDLWIKISKNYFHKVPEKFILYYSLLGNHKTHEAAKKYAAKYNMKLVVITKDYRKRISNSLYLRDVGPDEFIYLINKASYVVTDSFHGTAFSIIFNKQFIMANYNEKTSDRAKCLIEQLDINPNICSFEMIENDNLFIDYSKVNLILNNLIKKSEKILNGMINKCL